jgi:integrase
MCNSVVIFEPEKNVKIGENTGVGNITTCDINVSIKNGVDLIKKELRTNNVELKKRVVNRVVENTIIEEVTRNYNISDIDVLTERDNFIEIQNTHATRVKYFEWINDFINWCNGEQINCLKITRREVECYLLYLCNKYSTNSVRSKITSVSAFYTFLIHRYPRIITVGVSPFYKLKLPKIKLSRRIDVVTLGDITALKKELARIGRNDILCAVELMVKYGFRVGIFEKMKIDKNGNWCSVSKEQELKGKFTEKEVKRIKETGLLKLKASNITNTVIRYTTKLFNDGVIGCAFSPHDLRHYYITKNGKDLSLGDFIKFSRRIHKNVNTTLGYMNV